MRGDICLLEPVISSARFLEEQGVCAIAGACGSFAYYQMAVANAVNVPVILSIMTQVPFIQQALGSNKKLCVVCAAEFTMNERVFEQCGITTTSNLTIREMRGCAEFDRMLEGQDPINPRKLRDEVLTTCTKATQQDDAIAAFLLQCSDLAPFGPEIQRATGLPVFDMTLLIRWLQSATNYRPYSGIYRRRPLPFIKS
jgi:Asp/Glu/hydantoin racemase